MDRNTITGLVLIALIIFGSTFFFRNDEKKPAAADSKKTETAAQTPAQGAAAPGLSQDTTRQALPAGLDSLPQGPAQEVTLENNKIRLRISSQGGRIVYAELKNYKNFDKTPLVLIDGKRNLYSYTIPINGQNVQTRNLNFTPLNKTDRSVTMALNLPGGGAIQQVYTLPADSYMVHNQLRLENMQDIIPKKEMSIDLRWEAMLQRHEKDAKTAQNNTTVYYRPAEETPTYLSETSDAQESLNRPVDWVSFKQQFFAQTLISTRQPFLRTDVSSEFSKEPGIEKVVKASMVLPYKHQRVEQYDMRMYLGPLEYSTLKTYDLDMQRQIPLGWSFAPISWVNRGIVLPVFNWLKTTGLNFGIIILILTIIIKLIVLPLTYRSYMSTAKMRILKPELDKLKEKNGNDMAKQQMDQMALYRQAGVSPLGGCLPLLLQFPILIAMFRFFPSSIELRQQGFLWADDLSTYDSIYNLPFNIPFYGDHVSLFTILMTISTLIYTRMNNSLSPQQKEFKYLSYIMPIMFLGFFNQYAAGLSLYYFLFNLLTFLQQYLFKIFVNEDKIKAIIEQNRKRPTAQKKGGLQKRLEDMQKRQQEQMRQARQGGASGTVPASKKPPRRKK